MADYKFTLKRGVSGADTLYPKTTWDQIVDPPETFTPTGHTIGSHTDVTISSPSTGQVLKYNGSAWVNDTDATGAGGATDLSVGTVTSTNVPILSSSGADITTLPAATGSFAGILTASTQSIGGSKTFNTQILAPGFEFSNTNAYLWDDGDLQLNVSGTDYAVYSAYNSNIGTGATNYAAGNHTHAASAITSGEFNTARLGSGTATTGYVLKSDGDGTASWAAESGGGGGATILYDDSTTTLTVSSTSYVTPTGTPELSLSAGKKYYVRCMGTYAASTIGTGLGLSAYFSTATGVTILGGKLMVMDTATTSGITSEDTAPWQSASAVPGVSANSMLATTGPGTTQTYFGFDGFVQTTSTATTLKIAFRTEVSATDQYIFDVAVYAVEVA